MSEQGEEDPFGTASLRGRVLAAWTASPARFREDANAEEDLALGGYRDRLVVELAQNAADAAGRVAAPCRLLLRLDDGVLVAANTGAPLDATGVEALATLRASAKRDGANSGAERRAGPGADPVPGPVGRFGVGFAAVLAVTDEPRVDSTTGSVRWSRQDTRDAVAGIPSLATELEHRGGHVPALRLPWQSPPTALPEGYDTAVTLPLRDGPAEALVRRLLEEVDDVLLLALPGLCAVTVEIDGAARTLSGVEERWHVVRRSGPLSPEVLADRPTEERARPSYSLTWAARREPGPLPGVVHAPTPTDEPLGLPAQLLASFPLDPSRRHVAPGPLTDFLVERAAEAYVDLIQALPDPALVPGPVPVGALDAVLRRAVLARLADAPFLPAADDPAGSRLRPRDALVVDGADDRLVTVLSEVLPALVARPWTQRRGALDALGVRRLQLADVVDALAGLPREPAWWHTLYAALEGQDREALGALPVPLADGRLVRGPRGLLLPREDLSGGYVEVLGLRLVHPRAVHPLLERLGAVPVTARGVLDDPAVAAAVAAAWDAHEAADVDGAAVGDEDGPATPGQVVDAVLSLVRAAGGDVHDLPWLGQLPLRDETGELAAACDLVLPGSPMAGLAVDPVAPHPELVERWGRDVLRAAGVAVSFALERDDDVVLDDDCDHDLDDEDGWIDAVRTELPAAEPAPVLASYVAIRDLDLVRDDTWGDALALLASDPDLRSAVVEPARLRATGSPGRADVASYSAWWLRHHARLDGVPPTALRLAGGDGDDGADHGDSALDGLYDDARLAVDAAFLRAVGVRTTLLALLDEPGGPDELLDRLADPGRRVRATQLRTLYTALAGCDPAEISPPAHLRVVASGGTAVVAASQVEVLDAPQWLQLPTWGARIVLPLHHAGSLAEVLDLPLASDRAATVEGTGTPVAVPDVLGAVLPGCPDGWFEHDRLVVDGVEVQWWLDGADVHAATPDGLARGMAWAAGAWARRHLVAAVLSEPARVDALMAEVALE